MYCVWKAKYRHLNLDELRKVRRREHWRARFLIGVLLAVAVLGVGGIVFALGRATQTTITDAAGRTPAELPSTPMNPESLRSGKVVATYAAPVEHKPAGDSQPHTVLQPAPEAPPVEPAAPPDVLPPTTEPGYNVQVAAAPSLQDGRVLVARLASAGYPAYLYRATVSDTEVFRVRVGPFDTLAAAEEIASQLQRAGYKGAWIAR